MKLLTGLYEAIRVYGLKKTLRIEIRNLFNIHYDTFLSPIDVMVPIDGVVTAGQMVIVSRMLDIERIWRGEKPIWELRLSDCFNGRMIPDEMRNERCDYFKKLIFQMDKTGWDYNLRVMTINEVPLFAFDSTHKLGYALLHNPYQVLPCSSKLDGWSWCKKGGIEFWQSKGLTDEEITTLTERYDKLMEGIDTSKYIIVRKIDEKNIENEALNNEIIIKNKTALPINNIILPNKKQNKELHKINMKDGVVFKVEIKDDRLIVDATKKKIYSERIERLVQSLQVRFFYYTPTITEANQLRILMGQLLPQ